MKQNIINSLKGRQINSEADASKNEKKFRLMSQTTPNLLRTLTYSINKSVSDLRVVPHVADGPRFLASVV